MTTETTEPRWLTDGVPLTREDIAPLKPHATPGSHWFDSYSVVMLEGFTKIAGLTRQTVEELRLGIIRKVEQSEKYGGTPVRHWRCRYEREAYEYAAEVRHALDPKTGCNGSLSRTHQRERQREAAKYTQVPSPDLVEQYLSERRRVSAETAERIGGR